MDNERQKQNFNTTHGGVGRCAVGVVALVWDGWRVEHEVGEWELHGQVRVVYAQKKH